MKEILLIILLIIDSIYDIKTMHIPLKMLLVHLLLSVSAAVITLLHNREHFCINLPVLPIFLFFVLFLAFLMKKNVLGEGDFILLILMSPVLGTYGFLLSLLFSFLLSGIVSGFLLFSKIKKGENRIPFVPFLTFGTIMYSLTNYFGGIVI